MEARPVIRVLFVCAGNICRSPTAEGVFRHRVAAAGLEGFIEIDSAGTGGWHVGAPPDPRSQHAARRRGFDIGSLRARQVCLEDFERFDYVLAMDYDNMRALAPLHSRPAEHKIRLFLGFAPESGREEVPDPFYGAAGGFDEVLDLIERAADGLLAHIRATHFAGTGPS